MILITMVAPAYLADHYALPTCCNRRMSMKIQKSMKVLGPCQCTLEMHSVSEGYVEQWKGHAAALRQLGGAEGIRDLLLGGVLPFLFCCW